MASEPKHGTMRRYKAGCRCEKCVEKNRTTKAAERARKRVRESTAARTGRHLKAVPPLSDVPAPVPTSTAADVPTPATISALLSAALEEVDDDSLIAEYRRARAVQLATVLDDPSQARLWRGISEALDAAIAELLPAEGEGGEKSRALRDIMEALRSS